MIDAQPDRTRPGDTQIIVSWEKREKIDDLLGKDNYLKSYLSNHVSVGIQSPLYFGLAVDSSRPMGSRAHLWKPGAQFPVGTDEDWRREMAKQVLAIVAPLDVDPIIEWILVWPIDQNEKQFTKMLPFTIAR
jgi:hypothetical protein